MVSYNVTVCTGYFVLHKVPHRTQADDSVRCHKPAAGGKATFHSLDTRPGVEGGAVFKTGEPLGWFDY